MVNAVFKHAICMRLVRELGNTPPVIETGMDQQIVLLSLSVSGDYIAYKTDGIG